MSLSRHPPYSTAPPPIPSGWAQTHARPRSPLSPTRTAQELLADIDAAGARTILVLGGSDTGKTTLIEALCATISAKGGTAAVIDCDVGQSHIGPPSTIAWARCGRRFRSLESLPVRGMFFTGAISPSGNTSRCLEGLARLYPPAAKGGGTVIIDSDGYVTGGEAVAFKARLFRLARPDCVIALETDGELGPILTKVHPRLLLKASLPAARKTVSSRSRYRALRFRSYFRPARPHRFPRRLLIPLWPAPDDDRLPGMLVGLTGKDGLCLCVGVILAATAGTVSVRSPCGTCRGVRSLILGKARIELTKAPR